MNNVAGFTCVICGRTYPPDFAGYVCEDHGTEGILDVVYDYDAVATDMTKESLAADPDTTMWRYRALLPLSPATEVPPLTVGGTPMYDAPTLAMDLGIAQVWVKDEGREPTASLKDRASAMAVVNAQERGAEIITTAAAPCIASSLIANS